LPGDDEPPGEVAGDDEGHGSERRVGDGVELVEGFGEDLGRGGGVQPAPGGEDAVAVGEGDGVGAEQTGEAPGGLARALAGEPVGERLADLARESHGGQRRGAASAAARLMTGGSRDHRSTVTWGT